MSATVHTLRPVPGRLWIIHPADEARTLAAALGHPWPPSDPSDTISTDTERTAP